MTAPTRSPWRIVRRVGLGVIAALVVALATQALWLAPLVGREIAARAGREVRVESMWVGISPALAPVLHFRGIRIANAPWADSAGPFVALASATAELSWKSVAQRRPVVALWTLTDGEVDLERTADGLRNWRLADPENRGPGRWKTLAVRGERVTVRFRHDGIALDLRATASAAGASAAAADPRPTRLELQGRWRDVPFTISADTGPVLTFMETGATFPVRGSVESGQARLDLDGRAGDILRQPTVDATVRATLPSPLPFAAFLTSPRREAKAIRLEGKLDVGAGRYAISAAKARVGATDLAGEASWARGDDRNAVRARLESDSADVADLRWLAGLSLVNAPSAGAASAPLATTATPAATATPATPAATATTASAATGRRGAARELDAEISFVAKKLRAAELPALQSGRLDAVLADGRLTVSRFESGVAQGRVAGRASLALRETPMRGEADIDVTGVRVERLLTDAGASGRLTGALRGHATLRSTGDSAQALRAGVSGRIAASLAGGTISSLLDAEIGLQGGKIVRSLIGGAEPIGIRCASAILDLERGAGRFGSLVLDTDRTRTTGSGTVDFAAGTLDVVLTPRAKQAGLFDLERSIRLSGPLRHPARSLIPRVGAAPAGAGCDRS